MGKCNSGLVSAYYFERGRLGALPAALAISDLRSGLSDAALACPPLLAPFLDSQVITARISDFLTMRLYTPSKLIPQYPFSY